MEYQKRLRFTGIVGQNRSKSPILRVYRPVIVLLSPEIASGGSRELVWSLLGVLSGV